MSVTGTICLLNCDESGRPMVVADNTAYAETFENEESCDRADVTGACLYFCVDLTVLVMSVHILHSTVIVLRIDVSGTTVSTSFRVRMHGDTVSVNWFVLALYFAHSERSRPPLIFEHVEAALVSWLDTDLSVEGVSCR